MNWTFIQSLHCFLQNHSNSDDATIFERERSTASETIAVFQTDEREEEEESHRTESTRTHTLALTHCRRTEDIHTHTHTRARSVTTAVAIFAAVVNAHAHSMPHTHTHARATRTRPSYTDAARHAGCGGGGDDELSNIRLRRANVVRYSDLVQCSLHLKCRTVFCVIAHR